MNSKKQIKKKSPRACFLSRKVGRRQGGPDRNFINAIVFVGNGIDFSS